MTETLARIRQVVLSNPAAAPVIHEERCSDRPLTPAAVLFPIVRYPDSLSVLLTQRTAHLRDHAGQISFPGGRIEDGDSSPVHAALREAEEEIGLSRERVEVLGFLPEYCTGTGFLVQPVVALVTPPLELALDAFEVAEAFEVPLSFILNPDNFQRHTLEVRGQPRQYFAVPYGERYIWGATAGMIASLLRLLGHPLAPLENPPAAA